MSACGPLLFATVFDRTASYSSVLLACAIPPLAVAISTFIAREPDTTVPVPAQADLGGVRSQEQPATTPGRGA